MTQPDPAQLAAMAGMGIAGSPLGAVAAGTAMVTTYVNSGGAAQKASFSVDIEQIPGLIASYEDARDKLQKSFTRHSSFRTLSLSG